VLNLQAKRVFTLFFVAHIQLSLLLLVAVGALTGVISLLNFLGSTIATDSTLEYFLIISLCMRAVLPLAFNAVIVNVQLIVLNFMYKSQDNQQTRENIDDVKQNKSHVQKSYKYTFITGKGMVAHGIVSFLVWLGAVLYTCWAFVEPVKYMISRDYKVLNRLGILAAVPAWFVTDTENAKFVKYVRVF